MLDTNIVSDAVKHPDGPVAHRLADLLPGQATVSVVAEGELRYGIARAAATSIERRVDALLRHVATLGLTEPVARRYGAVRAELARQGTPIGMNDLWIAAHALEAGLTLVTDNEREFRRVPGLVVENWLRPSTE
ncbi:MAG: type II toxin-antitoxin system VapC family toxin [Micrococcales bacterium]|nr:type II toxin-antitoxin system VapC family toxin [Micrococcales bacterium]